MEKNSVVDPDPATSRSVFPDADRRIRIQIRIKMKRNKAVMWIRIDRIRIHKIWSMRIRIQAGSRSIKSPTFQNIFQFLKVKKKIWVEWGGGRQQTSAPALFRFRLEKYNFPAKKKDFCWLNSAFPFILSVILYLWIRIRPDPDPHHWNKVALLFWC